MINAPSSKPISRSALFVAAGRAIGAREPDPAARNPDYLAERILGNPSLLNQEVPTVRALNLAYEEAMRDLTVVNCARMMTVRTRFVDEALLRATQSGAKQIVILGAGLDSYGYRCTSILDGARIFEVDRATMQAFKRQRVVAALGVEPHHVTYVTNDFGRDRLADTLIRHGCNPANKTFFIFEGVSMYLPRETVDEILRLVSQHESGSSLALDFLVSRSIDSEKWWTVPRVGVRNFFRDKGLDLHNMLAVNSDEAARLYLTRADGTQVGAQTIEEAICRMAENPASIPARSRWGSVVWQTQGPLRYHISDAVVP